ncbi:MAG: leucine-rich repeat protein [Clostridiales bacterium]|nr:leucine-rich repeat protein [Clostridiales bacterium]
MEQAGEMKYVFISHKNEEPDLGITHRLNAHLAKKGMCVWYDKNLRAGFFHDHIIDKLRGASCYILVASEKSLAPDSDEVALELEHMWKEWKNNRKILIPLVIDDTYFGELKGTAGMLLGANRHQAVIYSRFETEEQAFDRVADYLSDILEKYKNNQDDFEYNTDAKELLKYKGSDSIVTVPSFIKKIADGAFSCNMSLEKVIIPDNVKKIGSMAFFGCENLIAVEGMDGVEECGDSVFEKTKVVLNEENGYSIGGVVLRGTVKDGVLALPNNARTIADNAFFYCGDEITAIEMPAGLENIGRCTFKDCFNLKELHFPASIKKIGAKAFYGCTDLVDVTFEGDVPDGAQAAFEQKLEEFK